MCEKKEANFILVNGDCSRTELLLKEWLFTELDWNLIPNHRISSAQDKKEEANINSDQFSPIMSLTVEIEYQSSFPP